MNTTDIGLGLAGFVCFMIVLLVVGTVIVRAWTYAYFSAKSDAELNSKVKEKANGQA